MWFQFWLVCSLKRLCLQFATPNSFYLEHNSSLNVDCDFDIVDDLAITLALSTNFISIYTRARTHTHDLESLDIDHARDITLDDELLSELDVDLDLVHALDFNLELDCNRMLNLAVNRAFEPKQANKLKQIEQALSTPLVNWGFDDWWELNGIQWVRELRELMIRHRNIGHDWQFTEEQKQQLQCYYDANKFLVNLINIEGAVSSNFRTKIEKTLLRPWEEP